MKYLFLDGTEIAAYAGCRGIHRVAESVEKDGGTTHRTRLLFHANTGHQHNAQGTSPLSGHAVQIIQ